MTGVHLLENPKCSHFRRRGTTTSAANNVDSMTVAMNVADIGLALSVNHVYLRIEMRTRKAIPKNSREKLLLCPKSCRKQWTTVLKSMLRKKPWDRKRRRVRHWTDHRTTSQNPSPTSQPQRAVPAEFSRRSYARLGPMTRQGRRRARIGSTEIPGMKIIVLEALSRDFRVGVPWELFFADDLVIIATSLEECVECVKAWQEGLESKGLHVNMTKTKFMASGLGLDILQDSGKFPCAVCRTGVGRSSIRCSKCNLWVHYKKCLGLKTLSEDLSYEYPHCRGVLSVGPVDGRPFKEVEVGDYVLEAVDRFCYLGDMLSAGGGCIVAATARCKCAWGKF